MENEGDSKLSQLVQDGYQREVEKRAGAFTRGSSLSMAVLERRGEAGDPGRGSRGQLHSHHRRGPLLCLLHLLNLGNPAMQIWVWKR